MLQQECHTTEVFSTQLLTIVAVEVLSISCPLSPHLSVFVCQVDVKHCSQEYLWCLPAGIGLHQNSDKLRQQQRQTH